MPLPNAAANEFGKFNHVTGNGEKRSVKETKGVLVNALLPQSIALHSQYYHSECCH